MAEFQKIRRELRAVADPEKARILARFFKTGPGQYGEGDRFLGIVVPKTRKIARAHPDAPEPDVLRLLHSPYHEERLTALLILVDQYRGGDASRRKAICDLYLAHTDCINNWDLVDLTAQHIVGAQLHGRQSGEMTRLALSNSVWERRIAMLATYYDIRLGESAEALRIAGLLLNDPHDLIHKAVGWMLREVGKRCSLEEERGFLDRHAAEMPRTMLRYAIERFPEELRKKYMSLRIRDSILQVRD